MLRTRSSRGYTKPNAGDDVAQAKARIAVLLCEGMLRVSSRDRLRADSERLALLEAFGARLRALRIAAELSPALMAEKCRLSTSTISKAELGRYESRPSTIVILCDGLGCSPSELMGDLPVPQKLRTK